MNQKKEKKVKAKKNSTKKKKAKTIRTMFSYAEQEFFLSGQPATKSIIERFADDQLEYFNATPDAYNVQEYRIIRGVPKQTYYDWLNRNSYLKHKHAFLLELIDLKRKKRITEHDPKFLTHSLHMYSERHDEANKYKARLKSLEEEKKSAPIKIVFEDYREKKDVKATVEEV